MDFGRYGGLCDGMGTSSQRLMLSLGHLRYRDVSGGHTPTRLRLHAKYTLGSTSINRMVCPIWMMNVLIGKHWRLD